MNALRERTFRRAGFRLTAGDVSEFVHVPGDGTLHALEPAAEKGARFVLASTPEVYRDPPAHHQAESYWGNVNPVGPRGVYDEAKRFAEAPAGARVMPDLSAADWVQCQQPDTSAGAR